MIDLPKVNPGDYRAVDFEDWHQLRSVTRPAFENVYAHVRQALASARNILDIGGGDGHTLDVLGGDLADRFTVVDANADALERLTQKYPSVRAVEADVAQMPFRDGAFDAAVSISAFENFAEKEGILPEIERVLEPGADLTFFRDLPYSLKRLVYGKLRELPPELWTEAVIVPMINPQTKILDQFALLPIEGVELAVRQGTSSVFGEAALKELVPYLQQDWFKDIYGDRLEVGRLAQQFGLLVHEVEVALNAEIVAQGGGLPVDQSIPVSESLTPVFEGALALLFETSRLALRQTVIETDYRTTKPIMAKDRQVRRLRIDELSNAHVHKFNTNPPAGTITRVQGRTPVYTAAKLP